MSHAVHRRWERVRVPKPLITRRVASGGGATEQPNACGDGAAGLTPRFWVALVLTGVGAGLFGAAMMALLTTVEHLGFDYDSGSFQSGVEQASGARRAVALGVAGVIGGVGWDLLIIWSMLWPGTPLDECALVGAGRDARVRHAGAVDRVGVGFGTHRHPVRAWCSRRWPRRSAAGWTVTRSTPDGVPCGHRPDRSRALSGASGQVVVRPSSWAWGNSSAMRTTSKPARSSRLAPMEAR